MSEREKINEQLQALIDQQTDPWGIKVSSVEVKHVELPDAMKRVMARQAEAEREKRAKIIHAEGEKQAAVALMEAAQMLGKEPGAMQLRYLQTLTQVANDRSNTIVFPMPGDLLETLLGRGKPGATPDEG